ncbi:unnamed protein product [Vitrella brassicaformis CCMP3155]|uniref:Opioid growth factor receptor (OGFr) conserved domain-containing protein n=2 Tax=Vitrella brassicaformis TaxID=1169539 RepID=A0A0G4EBE4_VITBC|nr:unnamed protein product [Vitrella brassicaformis CCMP3155]|eukprot:CEL92596.1 unnamed protein product [Vitrella brassicaformis CCMP3155]
MYLLILALLLAGQAVQHASGSLVKSTQPQPDPKELLSFYRGKSKISRGGGGYSSIDDIFTWDYGTLNSHAAYHQWLFPTFTRSEYHPEIPTLTEDVARTFREDEKVAEKFFKVFSFWIRFIGMNGGELEPGSHEAVGRDEEEWAISDEVFSWDDRYYNAFILYSHNRLRISRVIESLSVLGLRDYAADLVGHLENEILWNISPHRMYAVHGLGPSCIARASTNEYKNDPVVKALGYWQDKLAETKKYARHVSVLLR